LLQDILRDLLYLRYKIGNIGNNIIISVLKTSIAAVLSGLSVYFLTLSTLNIILQLVIGCLGGISVFVLVLFILKSEESEQVRSIANKTYLKLLSVIKK